MPFTTFYGPNTIIQESGLWIYDGSRRICINYRYETQTGILTYAACVFKCQRQQDDRCDGGVVEPTEEEIINHARTTQRRFDIRPVIIQVKTQLNYDVIITTIRHEMCHGFGVKGPRGLLTLFQQGNDEYGSDTSSISFLSDSDAGSNDDMDIHHEHDIDWDLLVTKPIRTLRYITSASVENYKGNKIRIVREYFLAFKAVRKTGQLIYGAAISRRPESYGVLDGDIVDSHFDTAITRLEKKPVVMRVSPDNLEQLRSKAPHREDVMYEILDMINSRPGGKFLIRGY